MGAAVVLADDGVPQSSRGPPMRQAVEEAELVVCLG